IGILSIVVLFIPIIIGAYLEIEEWKRLLIVFSGFIPCFIGFFFAVKIEQVAGYYECAECGYRYVPTYKAVNLSMHMGRTRYMTCPKCGKKSWQKKKISKDKN
ncbi:MAG: DNA-binding protein, partial [Clostridia bacterium]|nr:DNA-binding protein [Clostridia bacterium]